MAIVVEEERRGPSIFLILGVVLVLGILLGGTYYLFFAPAPLVEVVAPQELETTSAVSKIELNVSMVTDSSVFKTLKEHIKKSEPGTAGRANPFEPF